MKLYLAPLEGITGWIFRSALYKCFGGFDKYFVPFIRPNQMGHFSAREKKDILPAHNEGMYTGTPDTHEQTGGFYTDCRQTERIRIRRD